MRTKILAGGMEVPKLGATFNRWGNEITHASVVKNETIEAPETLPLLSDEGREFLAGHLKAEEYTRQGRLQAEMQARREVAAQSKNFSFFKVSLYSGIGIGISYAALAVSSFAQGNRPVAVLALLTAIAFGAGSILFHVRARHRNL